MFDELFRAIPDIGAAGEPEMLQSNFIHAIDRLSFRLTPTKV